jgi:hypothetical protein
VIMITDGEVHDVPASAAALGFDAPVHALLTGKPGEFDRRLLVVSAPRFGIVGSSQNIEVKVTETTERTNAAPVKLTVSHQGEPATTKSVHIGDKVEISSPSIMPGPTSLRSRSSPLRANSPPSTIAPADRRGRARDLRVLLVSGEPHAGERTWRNMLKSDASVDLVHSPFSARRKSRTARRSISCR